MFLFRDNPGCDTFRVRSGRPVDGATATPKNKTLEMFGEANINSECTGRERRGLRGQAAFLVLLYNSASALILIAGSSITSDRKVSYANPPSDS
jgi:hypothetical protein